MHFKALIVALAVFVAPALAQNNDQVAASRCLALCVAGAIKSVNVSPCTNKKLALGFDKCLEGEQCPETAQVSLIHQLHNLTNLNSSRVNGKMSVRKPSLKSVL